VDVKVIRAGVEHLEEVARLFDGYRQFYGQPSDLTGARQFLRDRLSRGESVVFLALDGSAGVGFVQLYPSFSSVRMRAIWVLNDLFVAPGARRAGVARLLMGATAEMARSTGAARVVLATAKDNAAARALYFSLGYQLDEQFDQLELPLG
jgi:ribosomal protein S18 acetylase RimI-like enzyme